MDNVHVEAEKGRVAALRAAIDAHPKLSEGDYDIMVLTGKDGFDRIRIRPYNREDSDGMRVVSNLLEPSQ